MEFDPKTNGYVRCMPFEVMGEGGSGVIASGKINGEKCAVKIFDFDFSEEEERKQLKVYQDGMGNVLNINSNRLVKPTADFYKEYTRLREARPRLAYFQVMPYIEGINLSLRKKEISKEAREKIGLQAAQGLRDLHAHNIVHGDFRAANIIIEDSNIMLPVKMRKLIFLLRLLIFIS